MNAEVTQDKVAARGLKGIVAADTSICMIDGLEGRLLYCGYNIHDLAKNSTFEEVSYLLLHGELPDEKQLTAFTQSLASHRDIPKEVLQVLRTLPANAAPMDALRTAVSLTGIYDPESGNGSLDSVKEQSIRLTAQLATIVAAIKRIREGKDPVAPNPKLSHAGNFMYMLNAKEPTPDETRAMDLILILHAEHGLNASTFTARVIAATLSDLTSAVTGAIGALKGPLHGGANTEVLKTLIEIGSVDKVPAWVEEVRAAKGKFMGFGHAVYKVEDPRAVHLKELSRRLGEEQGEPKWYEMSVEIENLVKDAIQKNCNVDFYSASLQHYMGIPGDLFTCIFASSRIIGWCAHVLEQLADNKIIRPSANYIGAPERSWAPIASR